MATTNTAETVLWAGKPSQALALRAYTLRGGAFGGRFVSRVVSDDLDSSTGVGVAIGDR